MPFANKFRAMMDFPFPGDSLGDFTVENVDVYVVKEEAGGIEYGAEMVLCGPGRVQDVRRALKAFFAQHPTTFSGYGNPYQLWFQKSKIETLGEGRYAVKVKGAGARVNLKQELRRFLQHLAEQGHLVASPDAAVQEALLAAYLAGYRNQIQRQVGRYTRKLDKFGK